MFSNIWLQPKYLRTATRLTVSKNPELLVMSRTIEMGGAMKCDVSVAGLVHNTVWGYVPEGSANMRSIGMRNFKSLHVTPARIQ